MNLFDKFRRADDAESLDFQEWLSRLSGQPAVSAASALEGRIGHWCEDGNSRHRMQLFELAFPSVEAISIQAMCTLRQALLPLATDAESLFDATNSLLKRVAAGYAEIATEAVGQLRALAYARQRTLALERALSCHATRIELAYAVRTSGSSKAWRSLHALYRQSRDKMEDGDAGCRTTYQRALALALAEPMNLDEFELSVVRTCVNQIAPLVRLGNVPATTDTKGEHRCCFVFNTRNTNRPAVPLSRLGTVTGRDVGPLVDLTDAAERVREQIDALMGGESPGALGYSDGVAPERTAEALALLLDRWTGERHRSFGRKRVVLPAHAVVGFDHLCACLGESDLAQRAPGQAKSGISDATRSEWQIRNESAAGLALRFRGEGAISPRKGELIGLHSAEHSALIVGVIQRIETTARGEIEVGVRKIGVGARLVTVLREEDDGALVGPVSGVVVLKAPCERGAFVMVLPSDWATVGAVLRISALGQHHGMLVMGFLERCGSGDVVQVKRPAAKA